MWVGDLGGRDGRARPPQAARAQATCGGGWVRQQSESTGRTHNHRWVGQTARVAPGGRCATDTLSRYYDMNNTLLIMTSLLAYTDLSFFLAEACAVKCPNHLTTRTRHVAHTHIPFHESFAIPSHVARVPRLVCAPHAPQARGVALASYRPSHHYCQSRWVRAATAS